LARLRFLPPRDRAQVQSEAVESDLGEIDLLAEAAGLRGWSEVKAGSIAFEAFDRKYPFSIREA
jgi:predicted RecB family endonuclease